MKTRAPFSIEAAIVRVFDQIGVQNAAEIVGKSESLLRKASDPDHHYCISIIDAIRLDLEYCARGHGDPPIFVAYSEMLSLMKSDQEREKKNSSPLINLAMIMEDIGEVAKDTYSSTADGKITKNEAAIAAKSIDDAVESLMGLKRSMSEN